MMEVLLSILACYTFNTEKENVGRNSQQNIDTAPGFHICVISSAIFHLCRFLDVKTSANGPHCRHMLGHEQAPTNSIQGLKCYPISALGMTKFYLFVNLIHFGYAFFNNLK